MTYNPELLLLSLLLIGGCDDTVQRQLENKRFVATVKAQPARPIEPLPEIKTKVSSAPVIFRSDLFMPIEKRQQKIKNSNVCYTAEERGYSYVYQDKSIDDLIFLRYRKSEKSFSVTLWDGGELSVLRKHTLIGKGQWQLYEVNKKGVTLAQLDKCSQAKNTRVSPFKPDVS